MDPFTIAAGIAAIAAPIIGAVSQDRTGPQQANYIAWQNLNEQRRTNALNEQHYGEQWREQLRNNELMRQLAERTMQSQIAATINARGGRVVYDEKTNTWQVFPSEREIGLLNASDREQLLRLTHDAALRRQGLDANAARRGEEGQVADSLLNEFKQPTTDRTAQLTALLRGQGRESVQDAFNSAESSVGKQALRSGTNFGGQLGDLASAKAASLSDAEANATLRGLTTGSEMQNAERATKAGLYNQFASRASAYDDTPFQPVDIDDKLMATLLTRAGGVPKAGEVGVTAGAYGGRNLAGTEFRMPNTGMSNAAAIFADLAKLPPDDTLANTIGAVGQGLRGFQGMFKDRQVGNAGSTGGSGGAGYSGGTVFRF